MYVCLWRNGLNLPGIALVDSDLQLTRNGRISDPLNSVYLKSIVDQPNQKGQLRPATQTLETTRTV